MLYARKLKYFQMTLSCAMNWQRNIPFLTSLVDMRLILNYDLTWCLNIQVNYIVQKYCFWGKQNSIITTNLFMYTVYKYCYTTQWQIHVITNDSQFSNKWATKYPIFVIMTGYITHFILWRDIPPWHTSKIYCAKISISSKK